MQTVPFRLRGSRLLVDIDRSTGGVVILGHGGRIEFDDTLEDRLRLLESAALPNIRASIFGYLSFDNFNLQRVCVEKVLRLN
jgi:vacuolar-type H+-ATPase subunit E/Vma4